MRLKQVRKAHKQTQAQIADYLGIPLRTYQNYEREVNDPDSSVLCKLADYYDVTLDYLLEISDIPNPSKVDTVTLTPLERQLLDLFRQMTDEDKETFIHNAQVYAYAGGQKKEAASRVAGIVREPIVKGKQ